MGLESKSREVLLDALAMMVDKRREVTFSPKEIGKALREAALLLERQYRETEPVSMEEWIGRVIGALRIEKNRKQHAEHGPTKDAELALLAEVEAEHPEGGSDA